MILTKTPSTLKFKVHKREPEVITPVKPTPHEFKPLSDLDDRRGLRFFLPAIFCYPNNPTKIGVDPATVIREAVGKTLVFYYPYAGRLREGPDRKLTVECTGEGILFIEADADVTLEQLGCPVAPPFPCIDELFFNAPGSNEMLNSPLVHIQVTRLNCGGFIFSIRLNHTISDGSGMIQFISAIGEMAKGANSPSVLPTWERHVFCVRNPPQVTCLHPEYNRLAYAEANKLANFDHDLFHQCFFFGPAELSALRRSLPLHLRKCSTFAMLAACVWKCRVIALEPHPTEEMRLLIFVNLRGKIEHLLPPGYYGNAIVITLAVSTAKQLSERPISFGLELIRNAMENVTEEFVQSQIDLMVTGNRLALPLNMMCYIASDVTRGRFEEVDFGWGNALYGGPASAMPILGYHIGFKTKNGENGIMLSHCMPTQAMQRFAKELNNMLQDATKPILTMSAL